MNKKTKNLNASWDGRTTQTIRSKEFKEGLNISLPEGRVITSLGVSLRSWLHTRLFSELQSVLQTCASAETATNRARGRNVSTTTLSEPEQRETWHSIQANAF